MLVIIRKYNNHNISVVDENHISYSGKFKDIETELNSVMKDNSCAIGMLMQIDKEKHEFILYNKDREDKVYFGIYDYFENSTNPKNSGEQTRWDNIDKFLSKSLFNCALCPKRYFTYIKLKIISGV